MSRDLTWRTVDIVVAAALAVAFGVVFFAWNNLWELTKPAFAAMAPAQYLISGVWLIPAVLGGLIIRKPGAALFTELVAATVSAILGSVWGLDTLLSGAIQGAAAEFVFGATLYANWSLGTAIAAAAAAAVGEWLHDMPVYYAALDLGQQLVIGVFMVVSAVAIAGVGSWLLVRSLAQTGVLAQFAAGRAQTRI
ncbi:MAG TPA: ECF transporter S component [Candidatus Limnocylindria bacterium]|jgi:energy-coupling factor transport system substrate-specific component|nr:ECF transporter S component [Candidatus Limnocylindria bacterium]